MRALETIINEAFGALGQSHNAGAGRKGWYSWVDIAWPRELNEPDAFERTANWMIWLGQQLRRTSPQVIQEIQLSAYRTAKHRTGL
jgi:hypothetical protein